MDMEEYSVSLVPYEGQRLNEVKGWNGFVSPDGIFYKVCEFGNMESVHDNFTTTFVSIKYNEDILKKYEQLRNVKAIHELCNLSPKDIFINVYGFVNFEYAGGRLTLAGPRASIMVVR